MWVIVTLFFIGFSEAYNISGLLQSDPETWVNYTQLKPMILREMENNIDSYVLYLKMFDASTKFPSGILAGSFIDLGNFDECYDIQSNGIYGKYCLGVIPIAGGVPTAMELIDLNPQARSMLGLVKERNQNSTSRAGFGIAGGFVGLTWAICVPSTMKAEDIIALPKFDEGYCYSRDKLPSLSTGAKLTITTLAVFIAISLISTAYDFYLYYAKQKTAHEMLLAFSYFTNGQKLLKTNRHPDNLLCLNGIRAISMMWVILSHTYSNALYAPLLNITDAAKWMNDPWNMIINGATVSVDTFFAVAGLVTVYTFLKAVDKGQIFNILTYYLHRYLRLTPAMGIAMLVYYNLTYYFGNGPLWVLTKLILQDTCTETWWSTLLYIANYLHDTVVGITPTSKSQTNEITMGIPIVVTRTCIPQGWYLQVDMQLFILSPLILLPLIYWRKVAYVELALCTFAGMAIPFCLAYFDEVQAPLVAKGKNFEYYAAPYARFGPYVIGMIAGLLIHQMKKTQSKKMNFWLVSAMWLGALSLLHACLFAGHKFSASPRSPAAQEPLANAFFLALNRNGWAIGVCLVAYLCIAGYGGPVDLFLSHSIFQFLSKLSYSMYLIHFAVIIMANSASRTLIRFSNSKMMFDFWGYFMMTIPLSIVLCLTFESPIIIIEKWIFGRDASKKAESMNNDTNGTR